MTNKLIQETVTKIVDVMPIDEHGEYDLKAHSAFRNEATAIISQTISLLLATLQQEVEKMRKEGEGAYEKGSEFATPRDYRFEGYNQAIYYLASLLSATKDELK